MMMREQSWSSCIERGAHEGDKKKEKTNFYPWQHVAGYEHGNKHEGDCCQF